jgi:hypothetical protein
LVGSGEFALCNPINGGASFCARAARAAKWLAKPPTTVAGFAADPPAGSADASAALPVIQAPGLQDAIAFDYPKQRHRQNRCKHLDGSIAH